MANNFFFSTVNSVLAELRILITCSSKNMKYVEAIGNLAKVAQYSEEEEAIRQAVIAIAYIEQVSEGVFGPLKCEHIDSALRNLVRWREQKPHIWSELNTRSRALRDAIEIELKEYLYYQYPKNRGQKLKGG